MEGIFVVGEIIRLDGFLREVGYCKDKFIAVDVREILRGRFSSDFPHYIAAPTKHEASAFTNYDVWISGAYVNTMWEYL
jgi:hypothetical protein